MKKIYIEPKSEVMWVAEEELICGSTTANVQDVEINDPNVFGAREVVDDYTTSSRDVWSEEW